MKFFILEKDKSMVYMEVVIQNVKCSVLDLEAGLVHRVHQDIVRETLYHLSYHC